MINPLQKKILMLALLAGEILLKSGSEIYRVEDTVIKLCKAFRIPYAEVFATTTGIFISLDSGDEALPHTLIRRIKGTGTDLAKISAINSISRELAFSDTEETGSLIEESIRRLEAIRQAPPYRLPVQMLGAAMIASFFTLMLGGVWQDFACALLIGVCSYGFSLFLQHIKLNPYIRYFMACALTAFLSILALRFGPGENLNAIIIGGIMIFLPGLAITNAVRDSLAGDLLAGSARALDAALIAATIAAGVGMVLALWVLAGGVLR